MRFKNQICTSIEQSKKLLELGVNPETADMKIDLYFPNEPTVTPTDVNIDWSKQDEFIPTWSLYRLIELCPEYINLDGYADTTYWFKLYKLDNKIIYENDYDRWIYLGDGDNLFDTLIDCIEWLIKEKYFYQELLK